MSIDGRHAWICCHPLDEPGEEDRMLTRDAMVFTLAWLVARLA